MLRRAEQPDGRGQPAVTLGAGGVVHGLGAAGGGVAREHRGGPPRAVDLGLPPPSLGCRERHLPLLGVQPGEPAGVFADGRLPAELLLGDASFGRSGRGHLGGQRTASVDEITDAVEPAGVGLGGQVPPPACGLHGAGDQPAEHVQPLPQLRPR